MSAEAKTDEIPSHVLAELEDLACDNYILAETVAELIRCVGHRGDVELPRAPSDPKH